MKRSIVKIVTVGLFSYPVTIVGSVKLSKAQVSMLILLCLN